METITTGGRILLYPVRGFLLPAIKQKRLQFFKSVIGDDKKEEDFELTRKEFIILSSLYQANFNYLLIYLDLVSIYGGIFVTLFYILLQLSIGMPLYLLCTFMSSYAKRGFFKFWECVPIFQGLGYTIAIFRYTIELHNIMLASLTIVLISDMFREKHRSNIISCEGETSGMNCLIMYPIRNFTQQCPTPFNMRQRNETCYVATQYHFRSEIMRYNGLTQKCCTLNTRMAIASLCVWSLIFCLSIFGMNRIRKVTINVQFVFGAMLLIVALYSVSFAEGMDKSVSLSPETRMDKFEFWVDMIVHASETSLLGNVIYLGKLKPQSLTSRHAALIISLTKIILFTLIICYTSKIRHQIIAHYRFMDPRCLISTSHDIMFAFVPDVLYRLQFGTIFILIWYLGIFCFAILPPVYSLMALVDSLTEQFEKLNKYRLFMYVVFCLIGVVLHIALCTNLNFPLIYTYQKYGVPLVKTTILLLLTLALMFIYSIKRIVDDYSFTLGVPPHKYWIVFWRTTPIFALFAFIFMIYQIQGDVVDIFATSQLMIFSYIQCSMVLLPVGIVFLAKCCRHVKYRTLGSLSKPSEKWGPHNSIKKQSRKYFYPQRDVKYRNNVLNCKHNCMTSSAKFYEENRKQSQKLDALVSTMTVEKP